MLTQRPAPEVASADAAIDRVLQSEQGAREAVANCAAEAELLVAQANEAARRCAERAAARIARVHAHAQARLQARLAEIEHERTGLDASASATLVSEERRRAVIEQLAAELTTEPP
ncbi:MAG: hypothetical protein ACM3PU_10690 [Gemmatimonadota bacterium]